ncbi:MAG TPA: PorV/PorQ family protein [Caldithrix sp.]|nr:PorV/PorQ family protein [Caldithrix sp.]
MMKYVFIFLIIFVTLNFAQYERPGSTDAQFLKIDVSPRSAGMGSAFISVSNGAEATYYNPAALARVKNLDFVFTHTEWFAGIKHEFAAGVKNFGAFGTFGFSAIALYTDEMKVRTPLQPDGTGETFYAGNYKFGISYGRLLTDHVSLGGTFNFVHLSLYQDFKANGIGGDIAVLYVTNFRRFRFGMKIANFGSEIKFVNESYPLPTNFQFGLSMNAIQSEQQHFLVSFSAIKPNDGQPLGQVGGEWNWREIIFLRAGYRFNHGVAKYSFGGGLYWNISSTRLRFDYSYSDFSLLGSAHRFGIGFSL